MPRKIHNLVGQKFGRLTVVVRHNPSEDGVYGWDCVCECGKSRVYGSQALLRPRGVVSCGCYRSEVVKTCNIKHGVLAGTDSNRRLYFIWKAMHERCYNQSRRSYRGYGGRGITVCQEWHGDEGLKRFIEDMGNPPTPSHSLDRVDNDKGYSPSNCRWATKAEQARNKRSNVMITFSGLTLCKKDWARRLGIWLRGLQWRLQNKTLAEALTMPRQGC